MGIAILPARGGRKGGSLQGAARAGQWGCSAPLDSRGRSRRGDEVLTRNAGLQVSGPSRGLLGVGGLSLRAGQLPSHRFNKEIIKRGQEGGEKPQTSVLLQIREDSLACMECVNHAGLGDVHNPA